VVKSGIIQRDFLTQNRATVCPNTDEFVYNFILESGRVLLVNDVQCVTFGHGIDTDSVVWDPFYATSRVLDVVAGLRGFDEGFVSVKGSLKRQEKHM